jgi:hypothetical protein
MASKYGVSWHGFWFPLIANAALLILAFFFSSCESQRPDFVERTRQDCERGDKEACSMLNALDPTTIAKTPQPQKPRPPRRSQIQMDVDAIMKGIEHARGTPKVGYREDAPIPDMPLHELPKPISPKTDTPLMD